MNSNQCSYPGPAGGPCWYCVHWGGPACGNVHGVCLRPGAQRTVARPAIGCAYWTREPGCDDDGWCPPPPVFPTPE